MKTGTYRRCVLVGLWVMVGGFDLLSIQAGMPRQSMGMVLIFTGVGVLLTGIIVHAIRD